MALREKKKKTVVPFSPSWWGWVSSSHAPRYVNTLLKLIPLVLGLQDQLRQAVQNGDMETSHGICRIAVALGENHSR